MREPLLLPPEDHEDLGAEDLIRRYLPRLGRPPLEDRLPTHAMAFLPWTLVGMVLSYVTLGPQGLGSAASIAMIGGSCAAGAAGLEAWMRRRKDDFAQKLSSGELNGLIAERFRAEVESYRQRTLGPHSDWARARDPLIGAKDEANRSAAYWQERLIHEPENRDLLTHLEAARELETKFKSAISEIDGRTEALRSFFNQCEAKLSSLDRLRRDREESMRLARLSDRAEVQIADARDSLARLAAQFVGEAVLVARAISGIERLRLIQIAGEVPVDDLETVAEMIVGVSATEREMLREMQERLTA